MTPPHTPESLLALTKSPEGLEQLRIIAAEYEGFTKGYINGHSSKHCLLLGGYHYCHCRDFPNYPTSLDAIFAAEERLGLHDRDNGALRQAWYIQASCLIEDLNMEHSTEDFAFLPPPLRLITFILTAQWKEQNL